MNLSQYKLSQCSIVDNQDLFHICDVDLGFRSNPSSFYFFCHICDHFSKVFEVYKTSTQSVHKFLSTVANRPTDKQKETQTNKQHSRKHNLHSQEINYCEYTYCFHRWILSLFTGYCIISHNIFLFSLLLIQHCVITIRPFCLH